MEEKLELLQLIRQQFSLGEIDIRTYSPLTLAFLGDCVFEIIVRTVMVERSNKQPNSLHKEKSRIVNAGTQAALIEILQEELTEEEKNIYRRGRNAKSNTSAKNASLADYRKATGFEAMCGYLYLTGQTQRIVELTKLGLDRLGLEI